MASKKKVIASIGEVGLAAIVQAMSVNPGYAMVSMAEANTLEAQGLVESNKAIVNGDTIAVRATQKGIDSMAKNTNVAPVVADATQAVKVEFTLDSDVAIPSITGRGRASGGSIYPFDRMAVGQSFFVAKEAKSLASTVSAANNRYATDHATETRTNKKGETVPKKVLTRQFIVRTVTENGTEGSRIWRKA